MGFVNRLVCTWDGRIDRRWVVLTVMAMMLAAAAGGSTGPVTELARRGVLDLSHWNPEKDGPVLLSGEWLLSWREWVAPGSEPASPPLRAPVPGWWNGDVVDGVRLDRHGFGTYRLWIRLPPRPGPLAIKVTSVSTAFRLYAGERLIGSGGQVGSDAKSSIPEYRPIVALVPESANGELDLTLFVSNFNHARGGAWTPISIGSRAHMIGIRERNVSFELFLAGAILIMALYHLAIFSKRKDDRSALYFGLTCLVATGRILVTGERWILEIVPGLPWWFLVAAEYSTMGLGPACFVQFAAELFPRDVERSVVRALTAAGVVIGIFSWTASPYVVSWAVTPVQLYALLSAALVLMWTARGIRRRRPGARTLTIGCSLVVAAAVYDMLAHRQMEEMYMTPLGLMGFVVSQALLLSARSARAMTAVELLTRDLQAAHDELKADAEALEIKVAERTEELGRASLQLERLARSDGLTGVGNRRLFDESLANHWATHARRGDPLSLILCDVDHFKQYNDHLGHLQGDLALVALARVLVGNAERADDVVARYGGEEFVVLLPHADESGARRVAERIRAGVLELGMPHPESTAGGVVTISAGVASAVPVVPGSDPQSLIDAADQALYRSKREGRNRVTMASDGALEFSDGGR